MPMLIQGHGALYSHPNKGHDRLYLGHDPHFFAVLDGAGGAELSQAVIEHLPDATARHATLRHTSQAAFLARVVSQMDGLVEGLLYRKSTGAFACIQELPDQLVITYANLGDSWLYFFDATTDSLRVLAHTPTTYIQAPGRTWIDTRDFLGAHRSEADISALIGELTLPKPSAWSLVGFTDGVQDDSGQGITTAALAQILATTKAADVPNRVLSSISKYDDAGIFVCYHA